MKSHNEALRGISMRSPDFRIVRAYYSGTNSPIAARRKLVIKYKLKITCPSGITIKNAIEMFERTGSVDVSTLQRFSKNFLIFVCATS
ncbi:hypothetical protein AVEN_195622-1 [Araneus ventricosus]|uniref:DUF4817 domain-containing protein n=1 Tax=Araneus ventricosus TaxID=182803 RepID=A0A4Y2B995_ARAVE|nr:hypothetical protein AVEN_195622-1 [Araneus ventricosus]